MIQDYLSGFFLIFGAFTLLISGLGLIRLPDFLTRTHPAAKSSTLGIFLFFVGIAIAEPSWTPKLAVAVTLFMFTGPVGSSALIRAALSDKIDKKRVVTEEETK